MWPWQCGCHPHWEQHWRLPGASILGDSLKYHLYFQPLQLSKHWRKLLFSLLLWTNSHHPLESKENHINVQNVKRGAEIWGFQVSDHYICGAAGSEGLRLILSVCSPVASVQYWYRFRYQQRPLVATYAPASVCVFWLWELAVSETEQGHRGTERSFGHGSHIFRKLLHNLCKWKFKCVSFTLRRVTLTTTGTDHPGITSATLDICVLRG